MKILSQWRIQDFPEGAPTPNVGLFCKFLEENCMKMKEFGPGGVPGTPLDPAMFHIMLTNISREGTH